MHVCTLSARRFPPNERLKRGMDALRESDHAVTVCARGADGQPDREIVEGIDVRRIPDESLYTGFRGKLDGARYALQFVHPAWLRAASEVDDEQAIDVCCVQDLSLVKTGLEIGDRFDVPVVCDLPSPTAAVRAGTESRGGRLRRLARRVFQSPWRRNRLVTKHLPDADRLVTTCEEARAEYVREKGLDPQRVAVVRDTADVSLDASTETDHRDRGLRFDPEAAFVVTAVADSASAAALETLVEAAARAADETPDLRLVLVGDLCQDTLDDLDTLARRRLAGGRITFRTETEEMREYVATSDVCVFPRTSTPATETTVPPELFEAMAMGVPVVASDVAPLRRLVTRTNAGRVVPVEDRDALTEVLVALADTETTTELGANGRAAVEREYNWERNARRLRAVYKSLSEDLCSEGFVGSSRNTTYPAPTD